MSSRTQRNQHSKPLSLPPAQTALLAKVDSLLDLPPIPGPKSWTDDVERAALWHTTHGAPPAMALCAAGAGLASSQAWLSDDPPEAYRSACIALAQRLKESEQACAAGLFANIHKAAQDPRYWTAAAWTLERKHGYVVKQEGLTGPSTVVNIGQLIVNQGTQPDVPRVSWRDDPRVIEAQSESEAVPTQANPSQIVSNSGEVA